MRHIKLTPEELTEENFADFGEVVSIQSKQSKTINNGFAEKFTDINVSKFLSESIIDGL